jgi:hypothetical protein
MTSLRSQTFRRALLLVGVGSLAAACGGPEPLEQEDAETLGFQAQALCTDPDIADVSAQLGSQPGSSVGGTSSSGVYGSPECVNQYVVEALSTQGKKVVLSASWVDSAVRDSQSLCERSSLRATTYGGTASNTWTQLNSVLVKGTWDSFFGCSFMWTPSQAVTSLQASSYTKLRIAARAYSTESVGVVYRRVSASISIPQPPPPPPSLTDGSSSSH